MPPSPSGATVPFAIALPKSVALDLVSLADLPGTPFLPEQIALEAIAFALAPPQLMGRTDSFLDASRAGTYIGPYSFDLEGFKKAGEANRKGYEAELARPGYRGPGLFPMMEVGWSPSFNDLRSHIEGKMSLMPGPEGQEWRDLYDTLINEGLAEIQGRYGANKRFKVEG